MDILKKNKAWLSKGSYINLRGGSGIPYNTRESPYLRKRFFTCPFILPKDLENIDGLKFFAPPLQDGSENFPPPPPNYKHFPSESLEFSDFFLTPNSHPCWENFPSFTMFNIDGSLK